MAIKLNENDVLRWTYKGERYLVHVLRDNDPLSPLEDGEVIGTVACWYGRYHLGHDLHGETPEQFWQRLVRHNVPEEDILQALLDNKLPGLKGERCENGLVNIYANTQVKTVMGDSEPSWELLYEEASPDNMTGFLSNDLTIQHCIVLLQPYLECIPLWLYDHSGITMRCGAKNPFYCPWDSGQVGWVVASKDDVMEVNPELTEETWRDWAKEAMEAEVEVYDQYLQGEVYGCILYKEEDGEWEEEDSCWGFFGDMDSDILNCAVGRGLINAINANTYEKGTAHKVTSTEFRF